MTVDVVVVSYNSGDTLRGCVEPLCDVPGVDVIVVDNDSPQDPLPTIADLPVRTIRAPRNGGFSYGCNLGAAGGASDAILFLNPDAVLSPGDLAQLVAVLEREPSTGIVAPRILGGEGELALSRRREPRLASTFAQALFLHRLLPTAAWTDEMIRDPQGYDVPGDAEWLSGACLLIRRDAFEAIGGFDEGFFLYCEDTDICVRMRAHGLAVRYEPAATARHQEGSSAPRAELAAIHARSRARYARLHYTRPAAFAESCLLALSAVTHAVVTAPRRRAAAKGHYAALRAVALPSRKN
ncbi:glycosyltransferase family 2 protein [Solirubrobacter taibaiensis]|nr:glycosyltransferase family 2 protein [Solirubrobacter taibaiensis]